LRVVVRDADSGKERRRFDGPPGGRAEGGWAAFSPDGKSVAWAVPRQSFSLWDVGTGKEVVQRKGHRGAVVRVGFSPDGTRLATGSWDGTVLIWEAAPAAGEGRP
jgi:WD40 repeat protein